MATLTLRNGKVVNVTTANAAQVADEAVAAQHQIGMMRNEPIDANLDNGIRAAVFNAANGTGGAVSGIDVPTETPVDYFQVISDTVSGSVSQIADLAKKIAPTLPTLDKLTTTAEIALVVGGLGLVTYLIYRFSK